MARVFRIRRIRIGWNVLSIVCNRVRARVVRFLFGRPMSRWYHVASRRVNCSPLLYVVRCKATKGIYLRCPRTFFCLVPPKASPSSLNHVVHRIYNGNMRAIVFFFFYCRYLISLMRVDHFFAILSRKDTLSRANGVIKTFFVDFQIGIRRRLSYPFCLTIASGPLMFRKFPKGYSSSLLFWSTLKLCRPNISIFGRLFFVRARVSDLVNDSCLMDLVRVRFLIFQILFIGAFRVFCDCENIEEWGLRVVIVRCYLLRELQRLLCKLNSSGEPSSRKIGIASIVETGSYVYAMSRPFPFRRKNRLLFHQSNNYLFVIKAKDGTRKGQSTIEVRGRPRLGRKDELILLTCTVFAGTLSKLPNRFVRVVVVEEFSFRMVINTIVMACKDIAFCSVTTIIGRVFGVSVGVFYRSVRNTRGILILRLQLFVVVPGASWHVRF